MRNFRKRYLLALEVTVTEGLDRLLDCEEIANRADCWNNTEGATGTPLYIFSSRDCQSNFGIIPVWPAKAYF